MFLILKSESRKGGRFIHPHVTSLYILRQLSNIKRINSPKWQPRSASFASLEPHTLVPAECAACDALPGTLIGKSMMLQFTKSQPGLIKFHLLPQVSNSQNSRENSEQLWNSYLSIHLSIHLSFFLCLSIVLSFAEFQQVPFKSSSRIRKSRSALSTAASTSSKSPKSRRRTCWNVTPKSTVFMSCLLQKNHN